MADVKVVIQDGGIGVVSDAGQGVHIKIGVSSKGNLDKLLSFSNQDIGAVEELLGTGPLPNSIRESFSGAKVVYAIKAEADIPGEIGSIKNEASGTGVLNANGSPLDFYEIIVNVMKTGGLNLAEFQYSLDGGDTYSSRLTVPIEGNYEIPETGITLAFSEDVNDPANSFKEGDKHTFVCQAPQASMEKIFKAIDVALESNTDYEVIHIVGESNPAFWAALDVKMAEAESKFRYIHAVCEARRPNEGESVDDYITALENDAANFGSVRVGVFAHPIEYADPYTGTVRSTNGAGVHMGRLMKIPVQVSAGRVKDGSLPGVIKILPEGINDAHLDRLETAGYITFKSHIGLPGIYVRSARIMAPPSSDYQHQETRRVMDKACNRSRLRALWYGDAEATSGGIDNLRAHLQSGLDLMNADGEIVSGRIVIPEGQNVLATSKLKAKIRIVPVPIMRTIELDIGFENPYQ